MNSAWANSGLEILGQNNGLHSQQSVLTTAYYLPNLSRDSDGARLKVEKHKIDKQYSKLQRRAVHASGTVWAFHIEVMRIP